MNQKQLMKMTGSWEELSCEKGFLSSNEQE